MTNAIVVGSLSDVAQQRNVGIAETFLGAEAIVIVDVSGSMGTADARGGKTRYEAALDELATLQLTLPGKVAVIGFSSKPMFVPGGQPAWMGNSTDLAEALRFAKIADVADMRFVVVSDGEPNDESDALAVARQYKGRIDTIFVGPEAQPHGRDFLARLAAASGGASATADRTSDLALTTERLLIGDAEYQRKHARPHAPKRTGNPIYK